VSATLQNGGLNLLTPISALLIVILQQLYVLCWGNWSSSRKGFGTNLHEVVIIVEQTYSMIMLSKTAVIDRVNALTVIAMVNKISETGNLHGLPRDKMKYSFYLLVLPGKPFVHFTNSYMWYDSLIDSYLRQV
jgi:hypothetical protein